jgi:hypothetical protein
LLASRSKSSVERRPVHPKEEGSYHGDDIRCIGGTISAKFVPNGFSRLEEERSCNTEYCSEGMNYHTSSNIAHFKYFTQDSFVQAIEDDL